MKQISSSPEQGLWNESLISQLAFIRRRLRFPMNRRTLAPFAAIAASGLLIPFFLVPHLLQGKADSWLLIVLCTLVNLPLVVGFFRYLRSLRFVVVPAYPLLADNMQLLERFFRENHFAYGRHPDAPEVFQMLSKNLGRQQELREVLLFIADDGRVLLNSHFSGNRLGMPVSLGHSREMARMLQYCLQEEQSPEVSTSLRRTA